MKPYTRVAIIFLTAMAIFLPLGMLLFQSFLSAPFFFPVREWSFGAYQFIYDDPDFLRSFLNSLYMSLGMVLIAVPLGSLLAYLLVRTDMPGRRFTEPLLLIPIFVSPLILSFGYVVIAGPVGFLSLFVKGFLGVVPWDLYAFNSIVVIAGLTHVPYVYLYVSSALRTLSADLEEAARVSGAGALRVALTVSLPMVMPAIVFSGALVFFLGFEIFGLALVLGDPGGHLVLTTYLYKLTNKLGTPSYHLMAAVAMNIVAITVPLVILQRYLLRHARRYVSPQGKGIKWKAVPLGPWKWVAQSCLFTWLAVTIFLPLSGITLRAFVSYWGEGALLSDTLTLQNFRSVLDQPTLLRGITNTLLLGIFGGALSLFCYTMIGLAAHRYQGLSTKVLDYIVLVPRALPGLLAGLAFLWVFLFIPWLVPLRKTLFSIWLAYTVVWLAYGMRLISSSLLQVAPEMEESARVIGATPGQTSRHITLPLIRNGILASWLLIFMIFEREYSTGVYLLGSGTEVIGSLLVSLWGTGAIDLISALSFVNIIIVSIGMAIALKYGVKLYD